MIVTHPYYHAEAENDKARKDVIRETVRRAAEEGDTRVEFVDTRRFSRCKCATSTPSTRCIRTTSASL